MRRASYFVVGMVLSLVLGSACGGESSADETTTAGATATATSESGEVAVSGRVILRGEGGLQSPLDSVTVILTPESGDPFTATTDGAGQFSFDAPAGTYEVRVEDIAENQKFEPIEVSLPQGETSFSIPPLIVTPG
jgi:hypothetical protein